MLEQQRISLALCALAAALLAPSAAQAALVGVTQTFPDISLTGAYLAYDNNAVNSTTGLLRVVASAATLNEGAAAGGSTQIQSYLSSGDTVPDVMLSFQVRNGTGGFTAGSLAGGTVSITMGNTTTAPRYSWTGTVNSFGFAAGAGTIFDATWSVTNDQYQSMPAGLSQFVNGFLTGGTGALKLTSSAAWGTTTNFGNDWIYGTNPSSNANLAGFRTGMTGQTETNSSVTADVWATAAPATVPLPAGVWLFGSGLLALSPALRRRIRGKAKPA
jgi:hypothetical protein